MTCLYSMQIEPYSEQIGRKETIATFLWVYTFPATTAPNACLQLDTELFYGKKEAGLEDKILQEVAKAT